MILELENQGNFQRACFGQLGVRIITSSKAVSPSEKFIALQALEDTVVSAVLLKSSNGQQGDENFVGLQLKQGTVIYCETISVVVASGKLFAYKG